MAISRKDLDEGSVDLSNVTTGRKLKAVHPGDILKHDFLDELDMSAYRLAKEINVPLTRITGILAGSRAVTADTALRLERLFGMSAEFWLRLQAAYDLEIAQRGSARDIQRQVQPLPRGDSGNIVARSLAPVKSSTKSKAA